MKYENFKNLLSIGLLYLYGTLSLSIFTFIYNIFFSHFQWLYCNIISDETDWYKLFDNELSNCRYATDGGVFAISILFSIITSIMVWRTIKWSEIYKILFVILIFILFTMISVLLKWMDLQVV